MKTIQKLTILIALPAMLWLDNVLAQPANDDFSRRLSLGTGGTNAQGSTVGATQEAGERCRSCSFGAETASSIWWSWTAAKDGPVVVTARGGPVWEFIPVQSYPGIVLAVFTGASLPTLTEVASSEAHVPYAEEFDVQVAFQAAAGTTYQLMVDSFPELEHVTLNVAPQCRL